MENYIENIDILIVEYLTNDISEENLQILNQWINSSDQNLEQFEQFKLAWNKSESLHLFKKIDVSADFKLVKENISNKKALVKNKTFSLRFIKQIAAITIPALLLVSSGLIYWNIPGFGRLTSYKTDDKIETIELSDNSVVVLNANSEIIYPKNLHTANLRNVELTGEAYFEVTHNNTPFIVNAGSAKVQVLGTRFNVNQHDSNLLISVFSGKVSVEANEQKVELTKNERATLENGKLIEEKLISNDGRFWHPKELKFNQANIQEICKELKSNFREIKKLQINTTDVKTKLTTTFKNQSLKEIIEELQIHFSKKIEFDGSTLTISD